MKTKVSKNEINDPMSCSSNTQTSISRVNAQNDFVRVINSPFAQV